MMFVLVMLLAGEGVLNTSLIGTVLIASFFFDLVVRTFALYIFSHPLGVAGDGARYFCTIFREFKYGIPWS